MVRRAEAPSRDQVCPAEPRPGEPVIARIQWQPLGSIATLSSTRAAHKERVTRWPCPPEFSTSALGRMPDGLGDVMYFYGLDVSERGMLLRSPMRNRRIVPGLCLDLDVTFPTLGSEKVAARVLWTEARDDLLEVGVEYLSPSAAFLERLGAYALRFVGGVTLTGLRALGLAPERISDFAEFGFVSSDDEYQEVLRLRHLAYSLAGKVPFDAPIAHMADAYDRHAQIVRVKIGGRVVATGRVFFHPPGSKLEHEAYHPSPPGFPGNADLLEVSRVATHPDFRGGDLLFALLQHLVLIVARSGRRWMVCSSTDGMLPFYKWFGGQESGVRFELKELGNLRHHLLQMDVPALIVGKGIAPIAYNVFFDDPRDFVRRSGKKPDWQEKLRISFYLLFRPFARYFRRRRSRTRRDGRDGYKLLHFS